MLKVQKRLVLDIVFVYNSETAIKYCLKINTFDLCMPFEQVVSDFNIFLPNQIQAVVTSTLDPPYIFLFIVSAI